MDDSGQLELDFAGGKDEAGYTVWQSHRDAALQLLARQLGLPLGHRVEVWLQDGVRLRGLLRLREEPLLIDPKRDLKLELQVENTPFLAAEIEACVRID